MNKPEPVTVRYKGKNDELEEKVTAFFKNLGYAFAESGQDYNSDDSDDWKLTLWLEDPAEIA